MLLLAANPCETDALVMSLLCGPGGVQDPGYGLLEESCA